MSRINTLIVLRSKHFHIAHHHKISDAYFKSALFVSVGHFCENITFMRLIILVLALEMENRKL